MSEVGIHGDQVTALGSFSLVSASNCYMRTGYILLVPTRKQSMFEIVSLRCVIIVRDQIASLMFLLF